MGSIGDTPIATKGKFIVPVFDGEPHSDPFTRPYGAPPKPKASASVTFPLVDFRSQVFTAAPGGDYNGDEAFMRSHGFTAVKHVSSIKDIEGFRDADTMNDVYYAEMEDLVKRVTGCKFVVINNSTCRGGAPPTNLDEMKAFRVGMLTKDQQAEVDMKKTFHKPGPPLQPIRMPHCDSTALGGRQSVRSMKEEVTELAEKCGILATEEAICAKAALHAEGKGDREAFEEEYNDHVSGKLGPRYAAFSIWRPMKTVTRDPLAMAPWSHASQHGDFVVEPYDNRVAGYKGDWKKEFAMLKVRPEATKNEGEKDLKFYYVSNMEPDEVLFVKLFDTAGVGSQAKEEVGCLHGSPDLGDVAYGETRESVEVRCMAFW
ncbi:hypothetical protein M409DRAFT_60643 [Zasmidium cellare ATCC 36951]|uniref:GA4 desaturase n=1 Tax=Zasmidium cellare ATCC 36951 TaxID=1080233 RepID=A0A6A6BXP4_ZASCE|nr:uncharacterized protein M409DRAFT_60643 [Zasmidium cellare ATCC 36951]KAF2159567.1 hypothetical protein M409DRAFT_60643 [Zasmidium cellare ATCC 36951]